MSGGADPRRAIFDAAVAACDPGLVLPAHLPDAPPRGRVVLLACGKAGAAMIAAAARRYRAAGLPPDRLQGLAVVRHGYGARDDDGLPPGIEVVEAGHPVPDEAGLAATRRVLTMAAAARPDDLVLALISGGGSANWVAPAPGVDLAEKQALTRALLRSGADIHEINAVRRHLSAIKGGRLAGLIRGRLESFAISDVPGDDPAAIASGPTVADPTTLADARAVLERYDVPPSPAIALRLRDPAAETPKPGDPAVDRRPFTLLARPADALAAAADAAARAGYRPVLLGSDLAGEARDEGTRQASLALAAQAEGHRVALISGGELTVTLRGDGRGGPNQEFALALAIALGGAPGIRALAADTDGTDGGAGAASDPAGALVDPDTLARARAAGTDARAALLRNDSTGFFQAAGGLFHPGPTRTNVNDLRVILVDPLPPAGTSVRA
ncbi:DUF4147 domain-containing protein [Tistrella mobilis]|uniref:glycerate kinase type-2 family protein n=1 Tax=Tistrella mobilis TaxID=171437 RepID=UPI003556F847